MRAYARLFLILSWMVLVCLAGYALVLIPGKRKRINEFFSKVFGWGAFRLLGVRIVVEGLEHLDSNRPCVFVGNHQSALDVPLFGQLIARGTVAIGKKELIWIPLFGPLFVLAGNITIRRQKHRHAMAGILEAVEEVRMRRVSVFIFPEGTRNRTKELLLPFKRGGFYLALKAGVPIVPMVCSPSVRSIRLENREETVVRIRVLAPIQTRERTEKEIPALLEEVRAQMQDALSELAGVKSGQPEPQPLGQSCLSASLTT